MRIRTRGKPESGYITFNGVTLGSNYTSFYEDTVDIPGPYKPGQSFVSTKRYVYGTLDGTSNGRVAHRYCPLWLRTVNLQLPSYDDQTLSRAITRHLATSNPSSSGTNYSETLAELPSLPAMAKFTGDTFLSTYGKAFLNTTFGWAPFLGDLADFLVVAADVDQKLALIKRAKAGKGVSSKRSLVPKDETTIESSDRVLNSAAIWIQGKVTYRTQLAGHTFVRWTPDDPGSLPSHDSAQRALAYTVAKGLQFDPYSAWQLMPWSWLTDWCFNVSDYLASSRNILHMSATECYAAVHATSTASISQYNTPSGLVWTQEPKVIRTQKLRVPLTPDITPEVPLLSAGQWGILSALLTKWA